MLPEVTRRTRRGLGLLGRPTVGGACVVASGGRYESFQEGQLCGLLSGLQEGPGDSALPGRGRSPSSWDMLGPTFRYQGTGWGNQSIFSVSAVLQVFSSKEFTRQCGITGDVLTPDKGCPEEGTSKWDMEWGVWLPPWPLSVRHLRALRSTALIRLCLVCDGRCWAFCAQRPR